MGEPTHFNPGNPAALGNNLDPLSKQILDAAFAATRNSGLSERLLDSLSQKFQVPVDRIYQIIKAYM